MEEIVAALRLKRIPRQQDAGKLASCAGRAYTLFRTMHGEMKTNEKETKKME